MVCVCVCVCVLCASEVKMYVHNIPFRLGLAASDQQPKQHNKRSWARDRHVIPVRLTALAVPPCVLPCCLGEFDGTLSLSLSLSLSG